MEQNLFQKAMETVQSMDLAVFRWINSGWSHPALDPVMIALSHRGVWIAVASVVFLVAVLRRRWRFIRLCCVLGLAVFITDMVAYEVVKPMVGRPRPCHQLQDVVMPLGYCGGIEGFPSNHAANGAAIAGALAAAGAPVMAVVMTSAAFLVGLSRVYLGVHFPGDVLGGWILGALVGILVGRLGRAFVIQGKFR